MCRRGMVYLIPAALAVFLTGPSAEMGQAGPPEPPGRNGPAREVKADETPGELEALIQQTKFPYARVRIADDAPVVFQVTVKPPAGPEAKVLVFETQVQITGPEKLVVVLVPLGYAAADQKADMLEKIADFNLQVPIGKLGANKEGEVLFRSECWLRTADPPVLMNHLKVAYGAAQVIPKLLNLKPGIPPAPKPAPKKEPDGVRPPPVSKTLLQAITPAGEELGAIQKAFRSRAPTAP